MIPFGLLSLHHYRPLIFFAPRILELAYLMEGRGPILVPGAPTLWRGVAPYWSLERARRSELISSETTGTVPSATIIIVLVYLAAINCINCIENMKNRSRPYN